MKRHLIRALAIPTMGGVLLSGCGNSGTAISSADKASDSRPIVRVTNVKRGSIAQTIEVTGSLAAEKDAAVSAKAQGRIAEALVNEGDVVRKGQALVRQDSSDLITQKAQAMAQLQAAYGQATQAHAGLQSAKVGLAQARTMADWQPRETEAAIQGAAAALSAAEARLRALRVGARPQERQQAEANVVAARANLQRADADYRRYEKLANDRAISAQQLESARAAKITAEAQYESARQALALLVEGARREDLEVAEDQVKQARQHYRSAVAGRANNTLRLQQARAAEAAVASARAQLQVAQSSVRAAQAQIGILDKAISNLQVTAPMDGVVAEKTAQPGQAGIPGNPLLRIVDLRSVFFEGRIPESQLTSFRPGQTVVVSTDAFRRRQFVGRLDRVYPAADPASRLFTVRIRVDNPDNVLRPGMFARGVVTVRHFRDVMLVPKDAVNQVGEERWVFAVVDGKAKKRSVRVRVSDAVYAMVEGIGSEDRVVVEGQNNLQDGTPVRTR